MFNVLKFYYGSHNFFLRGIQKTQKYCKDKNDKASLLLITTHQRMFNVMLQHKFRNHFPANIYLFKVNNINTRKSCEICSKLALKTLERRQ